MIQRFMQLLFIGLVFISLIGCSLDEFMVEQTDNDNPLNADNENNDVINKDKNNVAREINDVSELGDTDNFRKNALAHIFEGEINAKGQAVGFHYEGLPTSKGKVIPGTVTVENEFGVYEAEVEIENIKKSGNRGISSFFPIDWHAQQVVDAINEAFETRDFISGNTYEGMTEEGMIIRMYLDQNEKIISAFPVY